jgi:hypothetical protein
MIIMTKFSSNFFILYDLIDLVLVNAVWKQSAL